MPPAPATETPRPGNAAVRRPRATIATLLARSGNGSTLAIASGAGLAALAMNFWIPFLPLYMLELGAASDADALFWVGIATAGIGVARLVSGPFWGILSDRVGRKIMFIRALYFASATTCIAAFATEPWHVVVAFISQGLFSGFIPAAVALTSFTVSDDRLNPSLGMVTGAQYLGSTVGPAVGALLAIAFGLRGAIVAAALLPALAATLVIFAVPRDTVGADPHSPDAAGGRRRDGSPLALLTFQLGLALFLYFFLFAMTQLVRVATPIALADIAGDEQSAGVVGIAFTAAGIASVVGVVVIARRFSRGHQLRAVLLAGCLLAAGAHLLLALAPLVALYVAAFALLSMLQAAMLPASNTLIAANVPRARRGTAFGFAGSAQALAFIVGPLGAAAFAAISLDGGFVLAGLLFAALAGLLAWRLRVPALDQPWAGEPVSRSSSASQASSSRVS